MSQNRWTLIDPRAEAETAPFHISQQGVAGIAGPFSVEMRRLRGGPSDGVDLIEIDNGTCRIALLPTRGMGIWKAWRGDWEIGWRSPVRGPVHPQFVPLWDPRGLGWLSGFDELLVRCGLESMGPPVFDDAGRLLHPLHGQIANTPAHHVDLAVDAAVGEIRLVGQVSESRLFHNKLRLTTTLRTRLGEPGFRLTDEVTNLSGQPGELQLLYHVNFGSPLLEAGARVALPVKTLVPATPRAAEGLKTWDFYDPPQAGFSEQVYLFEPAADAAGQTAALLRNASADRGVSLHWNVRQLPTFTLWKSTQSLADGYVTGLEPGINYPNPRPYEQQQGRVRVLAPGETARFELEFQMHAAPEEVRHCQSRIAALQSTIAPQVFQRPQKGWAAADE